MSPFFFCLTEVAFLHSFFTSPYRDRSKVSNLGRNQMLFDFGLSPARFDDPVAVAKKIREIDQQFHLILIADRCKIYVFLFSSP